MSERDVRERDILVASNEYAYVQDLTKGDIVLYVGPTKISLSNTERLVDFKNDRFVPVRGEDGTLGVSPFVSASSSQYLILENPPKDPGAKPLKGNNASVELLNGRKVVIAGPAMFPLWPGQKAKVIGGHALREDEYLVVRVYDRVEGLDLQIGTELLVEGSKTSFYLPRSGLEVIPTERGYVRKAWRLRKSVGLHLRVIKPFTAPVGAQLPAGDYAPGQELFLKDREGFFFPTEHLEVIGLVSAIPIAEKEGIYVRDLESGRIFTVLGPRNYLPDPTLVELVERDLDPALASLYGIDDPDPARAVAIHIPPNVAVLVTARDKREVVRGPETRILNCDEQLEVLRLSTGKPKSDEHLLSTCFLQIEANKVSDVVRLKTADHVELEVALSYRVSFVTADGQAEKWFNVRNYVDLLCDHLGSILRAAARNVSIDAFHAGSTEILRSAVLGDKKADGPRAGRMFEENGMWVYDVEVLDVRILDEAVKKLLSDAQRTAIISEVNRRQESLRLAGERLKEQVDREIYQEKIVTLATSVELETAKRTLAVTAAESILERERLERVGRARNDADAMTIEADARIAADDKEAALDRRATESRVAAFKEQMGALQPELIATLKMLGNQELAGALTKNLAPLAILGGHSVAEVAERLLGALPLGTAGNGAIKQVLALTEP